MSKKGFAPLVTIIIAALVIGAGIIVYQFSKTRNKAITSLTSSTTTTTTELSTTTINEQKAKMFKCGESLTFTHKGSIVTYGTVKNTTTNECWLDRNLGASRVATAFNDAQAYGDLFQWGRLDDGHQTRTSGTTTNLSSTDNPGHANFILAPNSPYDWRSPQNNNLWQGVSGINNPCPSGWRIPTSDEWDKERVSWGTQDCDGAYASPLKLPAGDYRCGSSSLNFVGVGRYWSSTVVYGTVADYLNFNRGSASIDNYFRACGFSVRCLKD